jgi:hypothetical protein
MIKAHLTYAHRYWEGVVRPGDTVIDATVGNGHDTLLLAQLLKGEGALIGYDIQSQALENTRKRLESLPEEFTRVVSLKLRSHICFEERDVKLIVYNLGYLPGGDKRITTVGDTTVQSIQSALSCLSSEGAISITCYPGHTEGAKEQEVLLDFLKTLSSSRWQICRHTFNRALSPSLIWMQGVRGT